MLSDQLPVDPRSHLTLSFRLAEIIAELQEGTPAQNEIDELNRAFRDYRHAAEEHRLEATERLKAVLEDTAERHPSLISRAADLQSQLDEILRSVEL